MSQAVATPSPATSLRRYAVRAWDDPDTRSAIIGVVGVLLIHLLLFVFGPHLMRVDRVAVLRPNPARQFNIEIAPDTFTTVKEPEKPAAPKQFVETNPDAPENTPDKTDNFAAQNQQVAQEKPTPDGRSERPAMDGKKDFQSTQIVSGSLQKPEPPQPAPAPMIPPMPQGTTAPRAEQNPLPGFEKMQGENPDGFGTNIAKNLENARAIPERIDGAKNVPIVPGTMGPQPAIDPKRPRPRPSIVKQQQVRPAILAENKVGTSNVGVTAINAKFSEYGLYLQRMADAVQGQFDRLVGEAKAYPPRETYVVVKFILDSKGMIPRIVDIDNHSTEVGSRIAVSSITERAPYGDWTDDMKAALNPDGEELVFTFYYQ